MKIALSFAEPRVPYWQERLSDALSEIVHEADFVPCSNVDALQALSPAIIIGQESPDLISYLCSHPPTLQWVQLMSAGLDKTLAALGGLQVAFRISNMRGIHADAMAEYFLAVVLHFEKNLDHFITSQARTNWSRRPLGQISGKRLLVCGAGAIGQRVGEVYCALGGTADAIARNFGSRPPFGAVFGLDQVSERIGEYDHVFCALPLTDETRGVFGPTVIGAMKPGAIFVNIARGEQVDDAALIAALQAGHLRGAALDVFATEPLPPESPLWSAPRLLITPHVSGLFDGGHDLGLDLVRRNMQAFLAGSPMASEVFPDRGY